MNFYEKGNISLYLSELKPLETIHSTVQDVSLYMHQDLGNVLVINNELQHISKWSCFYHEFLIHLPMSFIKFPKTVLIIGGGDLYAAQEVLKYQSIEKVYICDWDKNVIDLTRKYYNHGEMVINNPKVEIIYRDAKEYLLSLNKIEFDLIINDCFNLTESFPNDNIYDLLTTHLSSDGVCCDLIYRHLFDYQCNYNTFDLLINEKRKFALSLITVPEYPGILHLLSIWGNNENINQELKTPINDYQNQLINLHKTFELFDPKYLCFYLYLPKYILDYIDDYKKIRLKETSGVSDVKSSKNT